MNNRIVFSKNGTLNDFSVALSTYRGQVKTFTYIPGQDYLFIGSRLPFNHIYFKLNKVNVNNATMKVEYFDGTSWINTVEVIDETEGFKKSGNLQFTPNRDKGWGMRSTNYNGDKVPGLEGIVIYDFYWTRISFDVGLSEVEIKWAGNLFSNDDDLVSEFPDLLSPVNISSWEEGKTNWEEQHVAATKVLVDDLVNKGIMCGPEQILDWREFTTACIQKTAEIIFKGMGDDYKDDVLDARKEYNARLARRFSRIDLNGDATETAEERSHSTGFFTR